MLSRIQVVEGMLKDFITSVKAVHIAVHIAPLVEKILTQFAELE